MSPSQRLKGAILGVVHMIKVLGGVIGAALGAGMVVLLSGVKPIDPAAAALAYGKTDRLDIRGHGPGCEEPDRAYEATCPRSP